jgi:hypothetical protein
MARQEQDREDLIAEATALVTRAEVSVPDAPQPVVLGLRSNRWLSVYLNPELVFHFNEHGALRRAHVDGLMDRSSPKGLSRLRRHRSGPKSSELLRADLSAEEQQEFLMGLANHLRVLRDHFQQGRAVVLRQVLPRGVSSCSWEDLLEQTLPPRLAGRVGSR